MSIRNYIQISGLPVLCFSHIFGAETYQMNSMPSQTDDIVLEITYITQGELSFTLADGSSFSMPANSLLCNTYSFPFYLVADKKHEHHTVGFRVPGRILSPCPGETPPENALCIPFAILDLPEGNNPFRAAIDEIILSRTMQSKGPLACAGLILQLLDRIDRYARAEKQEPYINKSYVKKAKRYIFDRMREPIRQTEIAEHLGISPEYLCFVFKRSEGIPIMQFINRVKLEQILTVMESGRISLAEACEMYGYADPNYVSRLFKKYFGRTVTEALRQDADARYKPDTSAKQQKPKEQ